MTAPELARSPVSAQGQRSGLAFAVVVVWCVGAASAHVVGMWPALGVTAVGLGAAVALLEWRSVRTLFRPSPLALGAGALLAIAMTAATYGLYPVLSRASAFFSHDTARLYTKLDADSRMWLCLVLVPIVVGEEIVWRGFMQGLLARRLGVRTAVIVGAMIYAAANALVGSPVLALTALGCGLVWGGLRAWTGSLVAPLIAHLAWDLIVLFLAPVTDSR